MQKGLSIREFARRDGCAESLVRKQVKSGRLLTLEDGSIDPELVGTGWRKSARQGAHPAHEKVRTEPSEVRTLPEGVRTEIEPGSAPLTRAEAERVRENYRAEREGYELEILKGNLVDRAAAERAIFGRARAERDAWMDWPLRISADFAAELNVPEAILLPILKRIVREHLTALAKTPDLKLAEEEPGTDE